jgi:hypothetical protein
MLFEFGQMIKVERYADTAVNVIDIRLRPVDGGGTIPEPSDNRRSDNIDHAWLGNDVVVFVEGMCR